MSLNQTLYSAVQSVKPLVQYLPLFAGTNFEPATSSFNLIRAQILTAPLNWPQNRATTTISLTAGTSDYTKSLPDFGWIEECSLLDDQGNVHQTKDVYNSDTTVAGGNSDSSRPNAISVLTSDGLGNIVFRFLGPPDKSYTATVIYQKAAPPVGIGVLPSYLTSVANASGTNTVYTGAFSPAAFPALSACVVTGFTNAANNGTFYVVSCTSTQLTLINANGVSETPTANTAFATPNAWAPLVNEHADVWLNLFTADMLQFAGDERAAQFRQRGTAALISKLFGLKASQKNPFRQQTIQREIEALQAQLRSQQYIASSGI